MNRKMISLLVLLTIGCGPQALVTRVWGSTIAIDSIGAAASSNDLSAAGNLDWAFPQRSEKAGGTAIVTNNGLNGHLAASGGYQWYSSGVTEPFFTYTDGDPSSPQGAGGTYRAGYDYLDGSFSATINLPVGSGTVTAWCETWSFDGLATPGSITATLGSSSDSDVMPGDGTSQKVVLSYSNTTAAAQSLTITVGDTGRSGNAGFNALAVSSVPEPGSVILLATGLVALLAYAWRKRR